VTYTFEEIGCDGDSVVIHADFELNTCTVEFDTTDVDNGRGWCEMGETQWCDSDMCEEVISKTIWVSSLCVIEDESVIHNWNHGDEITPLFAKAMQVAVGFAGDNIEDINESLR
jgi:hypothetical protein